MDPRQLISNLTPAEKLQLLEAVWDDLAATPEAVPVYEWQKEELIRRRKNLREHPTAELSWEEVKRNLRGRFNVEERESFMPTTTIKPEAHRLVEQLPDDATWEDLMYEIYVRQAIEAGIRDSDAGNVISTEELRRRFGLAP